MFLNIKLIPLRKQTLTEVGDIALSETVYEIQSSEEQGDIVQVNHQTLPIEDLISVKEASIESGYSESKIRSLIGKNLLEAVEIIEGRRTRIYVVRNSLLNYMKNESYLKEINKRSKRKKFLGLF